MVPIRYSVVFGIKDQADRFLPVGEFYFRGADLEESKVLFKKLPAVDVGNYIFRVYERYYDKHTDVDLNYKKSDYTIEADENGFYKILKALLRLQEEALEEK